MCIVLTGRSVVFFRFFLGLFLLVIDRSRFSGGCCRWLLWLFCRRCRGSGVEGTIGREFEDTVILSGRGGCSYCRCFGGCLGLL